MPAWGTSWGMAGGAAWGSSGDSTADSPSTPFASAGSGAFRQDYELGVSGVRVECCSDC